MLMDLGILLGQIILDRRPEYAWQLDLSEGSRRDDMPSFNSPVIQHQHWAEFPEPPMLDPEPMMVGQYFDVDSPSFGIINDVSRYVLEFIDGAHEKYWLDHPEAVFASTIKPGRVVRYDDSGMEGIVCSKEPVPTQDWIDDQVNAAELEELGPADWWGVLLFSGGYLLAPDTLLIVLREATYEDFLRVVDGADVAVRKSLAELFPDYVKQTRIGARKPGPIHDVRGNRTDSKNREATKREVPITFVSGDRQIAVVMTEKDERQFMAFLRTTAPISILQLSPPSKDQIVIEDLPSLRKGQRRFYLWNENFGPCAPELSVNVKGDIYVNSPRREPILEYCRASPRSWGPDTLGRLY